MWLRGGKFRRRMRFRLDARNAKNWRRTNMMNSLIVCLSALNSYGAAKVGKYEILELVRSIESKRNNFVGNRLAKVGSFCGRRKAVILDFNSTSQESSILPIHI